MSHFFKKILYLFISILIFSFYLFFTQSGLNKTYSVLSYLLSDKVGLKVKVNHITLSHFNFITLDLELEDKYPLKLNGFLGLNYFKIDYLLSGNCIESNICVIDDTVNIKGKIYGQYEKFNIIGKGALLDGAIDYSLISEKDTYRNILVNIHDITSNKLFRLLGEESFFRGKSNSKIYFDYIKESEKKGYITYEVKKSNFSGFISDLKLDLDILNETHDFRFSILSPQLKFKVKKGKYNQSTKYAHALYSLDVANLSTLKPLLGASYYGKFFLQGEIEYKDTLNIKGISPSLGGKLSFVYKDQHIQMEQQGISIEKMFHYMNSKSPIQATIWGNTYYDLNRQYLEMTNTLKKIKFIPSSISKAVKEKFKFDLLTQKFDDSSFDILFSNGILSSDIKIGNKNIFIALRDTKFDTKKLFVQTTLKFTVPKHQLEGDIYARMDQTDKKDEVADTYIKFDGKIDKYYSVMFDGILNDRWLNLDYTLNAKRFPSHICTIEDNVSIQGHINGVYSHLHFGVEGELLEGRLLFDATKVGSHLENVSFDFKKIHGLKLFTLLGYPTLPYGELNLHANFNQLGLKRKQGTMQATFNKSFLYTLPFTITTNMRVKDDRLLFNATASLPQTNLTLYQGDVNLLTHALHTSYTINNTQLSVLEPIVGYAFNGEFATKGEIAYQDTLKAKGDSQSFGGNLAYRYQDNLLLMDLNHLSLVKFTNLIPDASYFDANIIGKLTFDTNQTALDLKTKLNDARFLPSEPAQMFKDKAGVDLLSERFNDSSLNASYKNNVLEADVVLKNDKSHLYISNIKVDNNSTKVNAFFDFKMQGQEFLGKIYGTTKSPKVNLDIQRLLRYQMDKQLDAMIGKKNNKLMEKIPMTNMAKDVSTEMAASFVGMFF